MLKREWQSLKTTREDLCAFGKLQKQLVCSKELPHLTNSKLLEEIPAIPDHWTLADPKNAKEQKCHLVAAVN